MSKDFTITEWQRQSAAFGLCEIAEAFTRRAEQGNEFIRRLNKGIRSLQEVVADVLSGPGTN